MCEDQKNSKAESGARTEGGESSSGNLTNAATVAQANLEQSISEALSLASLNAVQAQQQGYILHQTVTTMGTAQMYASSLGMRRWAGLTYGQHLGIPVTNKTPVDPSQDVEQVLADMKAIANFIKSAKADNPKASS